LVSEEKDVITPYDYYTGFTYFLEYNLGRLPLLYDNQLEIVSDYSTANSQSVSQDWNRKYSNSLYYQQFNSVNQNHNIDCWIVTNISEVTNATSATNTSSDVAPPNVQIDFSLLLSQLTVATSDTNNTGNINIE